VPKRSEAHLQARRRQILDGARRAFARHGYQGATVAKLEEDIGLSRGAIFNYYPNKLELFIALATEDEAHVINTWMAGGFEAVLREIAEQNPDWLGVYLEQGHRLRTDPAFRERWKARNPELEQRAHDWLVGLQEGGQIRSDLPFEAIGRFFGLVIDGVAVNMSMGFPVDVEPILTLVQDAIAPRD